ncbi:MAG: CoA ester lyase [Acetobacteraceae bacterium]|nr:CoA ester lyase [Acetobacteraceae bacterium]
MLPLRSLLFVPASRPDRFAKALAAGADLVCADLEDAVAPADKPAARDAALAFLREAAGRPGRAVRINGLRSPEGIADLAAIAALGPGAGAGALLLPKAEHAEEIAILDSVLTAAGSALALIPLIESARGIRNAARIAAASPRVAALFLGGVDLAAELGVAPDATGLAAARGLLVLAARGAGVGLIDVPSLDLRDPDSAGREALAARRLGFTAKAVLHPAQVAAVNAAFTPTEAEVAEALRYERAFAEAKGGVATLDGKLVEKPVVARMRQVLAAARAAGLPVPD